METIGVVGVNCRDKNTEFVAGLTIPKSERALRLPELARDIGVDEIVYIATCNRVEVAFRGDGETQVAEYRRRVFQSLIGRAPHPGEAERTLRAWVGEGAVEHLFLVASGLDSAQLGEQEVRTQVREALMVAREAGVSGTLLDHVLTKALRVATKVQQYVPKSGRRTSLADIALEYLEDRLHETPGPVALIGVSAMTRQCGHVLAEKASSLLVVNRTPEKGRDLARELRGEYRSLDAFRRRPDGVEAVLVATGSVDVILGHPELERLAARAPSGKPPLIVDMSVPSNTDLEAARALGVELVEMNEILAEASADRERQLVDLAPARQLVDESLARLRKAMAEELMSPIIAQLNQRYRQTATEGLRRLFKKELRKFDEGEREAVYRWAEVLARRFAHIPIKGLRELAAEFGAPAVKVFLAAAGEDFLAESPRVVERLDALAKTDV
ncbi:MAG: hypothetical protein V3S30_05900 [Thermoanaerobaculia bacterium]